LWIINVDSDATGRLLITYSAFVKYLREKKREYNEAVYQLFIDFRNGLKQGDTLSPLLFNFALEYAIRRVQVDKDGLKLNGTHQILAYADDVNILGGSVHKVKENAEV